VTDAALAARGLSGEVGTPRVRDVNLDVLPARTHGVLGPIPSGKSLLLRHLVGLERAVSGTVTVGGQTFDARGEPEPVLRRMRTRIGVVFEGSALFARISVIENVELPLLEHTSATAAQAREAARELLAEVGLNVDHGTYPAQLGRAEQRRVALARARALRPPVLLLDEPTLGLDAHSAAGFDDAVGELQRAMGFGVLIFSHETRYAFGDATRIYVMSDGRVVAEGDRATLQDDEHPVVQQLMNRRGRT
jgi:phospholipid/cholesterol/gamma-HCH transport system ATP-binding protein